MIEKHSYRFKAKPMLLSSKFKPLKKKNYQNLMHDDSIIRGKTINNPKLQERITKLNIQKEYRKHYKEEEFDPEEILTPRTVPGRVNANTMTDHVYEILDNSENLVDAKIQTDPALNIPIVIKYNVKKTGVDSGTQISEEDLKHVYNPKKLDNIVRVILNKVLEESRMEVLEENEFKAMEHAKKTFRQQKMKLLNQVQRIEQKEKRLEEERDRRTKQAEKVKENDLMSHKKLVARLFSKSIVGHAEKRVFDFFNTQVDFFEQKTIVLNLKFIPDFLDNIDYNLVRSKEMKEQVLETIAFVNKKYVDKHNGCIRRRKYAIFEKKRRKEEEKRRRAKQNKLEKKFSLNIEKAKEAVLKKGVSLF